MLDQRQLNIIKSVLISGVSLGLILLFFVYFIWPIQQIQMEEYREQCYELIDGQWVDKMTCSAPQGEFLYITLGVIPFLIFIGAMNYFENKRIKTWRSYR